MTSYFLCAATDQLYDKLQFMEYTVRGSKVLVNLAIGYWKNGIFLLQYTMYNYVNELGEAI